MADYVPLRRDQLRSFLGDNQDLIKRFEDLFTISNVETPAVTEYVAVNAQNAMQYANSSMSAAQDGKRKQQQVITTTSSYTVPSRNYSVFADATSGAIIVTLPLAVKSKGFIIGTTKIDTSSNTVTIQRSGTDLIAGDTSHDLVVDGEVLNFISDGTNWQLAN